MGCIYRRKKKLKNGTLVETGPYWLKYDRDGRADRPRLQKERDSQPRTRRHASQRGDEINRTQDRICVSARSSVSLISMKESQNCRHSTQIAFERPSHEPAEFG